MRGDPTCAVQDASGVGTWGGAQEKLGFGLLSRQLLRLRMVCAECLLLSLCYLIFVPAWDLQEEPYFENDSELVCGDSRDGGRTPRDRVRGCDTRRKIELPRAQLRQERQEAQMPVSVRRVLVQCHTLNSRLEAAIPVASPSWALGSGRCWSVPALGSQVPANRNWARG